MLSSLDKELLPSHFGFRLAVVGDCWRVMAVQDVDLIKIQSSANQFLRDDMARRQTSTNMMPPITAISPPSPIMPMPIFCDMVVKT